MSASQSLQVGIKTVAKVTGVSRSSIARECQFDKSYAGVVEQIGKEEQDIIVQFEKTVSDTLAQRVEAAKKLANETPAEKAAREKAEKEAAEKAKAATDKATKT